MRKVTVVGKGSLFTLQFWIIFIAPKLHCSLFGSKCIFFLFLTPPLSFTSTSLLYIISNSFNRYTAVLNKMRKHFDVFIFLRVLQGELLSPCRCDGSVRCTHQPCLIRWISERGSWSCELCYFKYQVLAISTKNPLQVNTRGVCSTNTVKSGEKNKASHPLL